MGFLPINAFRISYDTNRYAFARVLERDVFRVPHLGRLHQSWQSQKRRRFGDDGLGYGDNLLLRKLMQDLPDDSLFYRIYRAFLSEVISPHYGGRVRVTAHPKMRVHLDGTPSVSTWHRDADITHRPDQINIFLPFTDCAGTNALWCESDYGRGDYQAMPVRYGEALLFDGGILSHGSVENQSGVTRISMDFRFTPVFSEGEAPWSTVLSGRPARQTA